MFDNALCVQLGDFDARNGNSAPVTSHRRTPSVTSGSTAVAVTPAAATASDGTPRLFHTQGVTDESARTFEVRFCAQKLALFSMSGGQRAEFTAVRWRVFVGDKRGECDRVCAV
jgi:hypothetical protein